MSDDTRSALAHVIYAVVGVIAGAVLLAAAPEDDGIFKDTPWQYDLGRAVLVFSVLWGLFALIQLARAIRDGGRSDD